MRLESLYQEIILDHYRHPHHAGLGDPFDAEVRHVNPVCGDEVTLRVTLKDSDAGQVVEGEGEPDEEVLGDAVAFAGVSRYPARIKCALLAWMAWKDATAQAMGEREPA